MIIMASKHGIISMILSIVLTSCSLAELVKVSGPESESTVDQNFVHSAHGAVGLFYSSLGSMQSIMSSRNYTIGKFTDELTIRPNGSPDAGTQSTNYYLDDSRSPVVQSKEHYRVEGALHPTPIYSPLNKVRNSAILSRALLRNLKDSAFNSEIAGSYAVEGYVIVMLAEDLCSGIPLSEIPLEGEIIYGKALTTDELFRIAVAKFDSALQIRHDSSKYVTLAKVGKGRALMGLGEYRKAAEAVLTIQKTDKFEFKYSDILVANPNGMASYPNRYWTWTASSTAASATKATEIVNGEGVNGMVWYSNPLNIDPRLPITTEVVQGEIKFPGVVRQRKYVGGAVSVPLARWIEAKMIESESYLKDGDERWIQVINEARRSINLQDTTSPANMNDKVDLLFRERAYWFYGEGVRLADYRRLVRQYHRSPYSVYPTGGYTRHSLITNYGNAFVFVPPIDENVYNYKYDGCFHYNP